ncbi:hypothetical protein EJB05_39212 [Eragrostis curvula]|uniref:HMA domain-containing protein n=1 Tax=Eragrostis curvula TaxID=38414 RepID=A0A5J9TWB4_9POAL|nr:hypothetical protein EJB05_39212 [Eragrostis curvula]
MDCARCIPVAAEKDGDQGEHAEREEPGQSHGDGRKSLRVDPYWAEGRIWLHVEKPGVKSQSQKRVSSVSVTGESKDQLEVVGEDVDAVCLVSCLRGKKEFGHVVILLVEDVKDKKKEEEEKKKKAEEEKKKKEAEEKKKKEAEKPPQCSCPAGYPCYCHPRPPPPPPPYFVCEEPATSCSIM